MSTLRDRTWVESLYVRPLVFPLKMAVQIVCKIVDIINGRPLIIKLLVTQRSILNQILLMIITLIFDEMLLKFCKRPFFLNDILNSYKGGI